MTSSSLRSIPARNLGTLLTSSTTVDDSTWSNSGKDFRSGITQNTNKTKTVKTCRTFLKTKGKNVSVWGVNGVCVAEWRNGL
jgi:hypothetical protein